MAEKKWSRKAGRFKGFHLLIIFFLWRALLFSAGYMGQKLIPLRKGFLGGEGLGVWANFDGVHYLNIAEKGYFNFEQTFFPLYPLLVRFFAPFFGNNFLFSSLFLSNLCFLGVLFLFLKLVNLDFPNRPSVRKQALLFLFLFPTSFFFGAAYTESLFLLLVLGAFLMVQRKKRWLAGVLGGLASATRLAGIFLFPAFLIEWFWKKKTKKGLRFRGSDWSWLGFFLIPLGLLGYMFYLGKTFGDPLVFIWAQKAVGYRETGRIILLPQVFWRYLKIFFTVSPQSLPFWIALLEAGATLFFLVLTIFAFWKLPLSYSVFMLLSILIPSLTGTLISLPRFVLVCFPGFILLGTIKRRSLVFSLVLVFLFLLIILTGFFVQGYFVS